MKRVLFVLILILFSFANVYSQTFDVIEENENAFVGFNDEAVFVMKIVNTSSENVSVYIKRTSNVIPEGWSSSLCFSFCFSPVVDSIATTRDFGSSPIEPGDTAEVSLHVFTDNNPDSGRVGIKIASLDNPSEFYSFSFFTSTFTADVEDENIPENFSLKQNYPNPFNPVTTIEYTIPGYSALSIVQLKIYDVLGKEVATLVNGKQSPGNYKVKFDASNLPSGIYFYRMEAGNYVETKKMILLK